MKVAILVLLLPALVLTYPHPQRSEGSSRTSRGKQRFNIEEISVSASDVEPTVSLSRKGYSRSRGSHESQREPDTASSVVAPVTQQLVSTRTSSQRRGIVSVTPAIEDKPRSRSSSSRRGPTSQGTLERGIPSRRRESSIVETTQIPYNSIQVEQATSEGNKENYPTSTVESLRNLPPYETSTSPSPPSLPTPQLSTSSGINRRRTSSNRNVDTTFTDSSTRSSFSGSDVSPDRQSRFESSRRRQSSEVVQDTSASEGRRNGRRNSSRGSSRANSADFTASHATNTQEIATKSRSSGRRDSTPSRSGRGEKPKISSLPSSLPARSRTSGVQSRPNKENENINNDIPVLEISEDQSLTASKRMDTIGDASEEPVIPDFTESISAEPESSSISIEESPASSSELPSTPDYSEKTPKPIDTLQTNRRKPSQVRSQSNTRDSASNEQSVKQRFQSSSQKTGTNSALRRGTSRSSRVNDNSADYSTISNIGYDDSINANAVNYRRESSNTEQLFQRSQFSSRRNQPGSRGNTEESEVNISGTSSRGAFRRNFELPKNSNEVSSDAGLSVQSPRNTSSRRTNASDISRRLSGSERRGGRGYSADIQGPHVEENYSRRSSRTRSNGTARAELNTLESVRPVTRSGRRTSEVEVTSAAQRTSRRTSPEVGQRGNNKVRCNTEYNSISSLLE